MKQAASLGEAMGRVHYGIEPSEAKVRELRRSLYVVADVSQGEVLTSRHVRLVTEPAMIAVKADSPHKTLKDLMDAALKNPGKVKQSGGSPMSRDGVVRAMLQKATGAQWAFISFPGGGERIAALLGGHVDFMIVEPQEAGEHIRNGNLRVIAQVNEKRLEKYANVPTIKEAGFNVPYYAVFRGIVHAAHVRPVAGAPPLIEYSI